MIKNDYYGSWYQKDEWNISPRMAKFFNDFVLECQAKESLKRQMNHDKTKKEDQE